ncbi:MAG: pilus assembly protein CpaA [Lachnospiraceae bacterium]|jgi:leader peptidase (prepilin peptidase)/N-methyltransferase|nr:pilus assembly protein CpaA [Lachnospiraceae bacterium]
MKLFSAVLVWAAWQDIERHSLGNGFLILSAGLGLALCIGENGAGTAVLAAMLPGLVLLIFGRLTCGGIGRGDGWFFVVAGFYLNLWENVWLLASGLILCGIYSLILAVLLTARGRNIRKLRLPFIPFLLPAGLWLCLFS